MRFPRTVLLAWVSLAILAGFGVGRLRIETSTDSILDRGGPEWQFYQESQLRFGGDEIFTLLIDGSTPFDPSRLQEVIRITEAFEGFEGVWRVDSLATVPLIQSTSDGSLSLQPALSRGVPQTRQELDSLGRRVMADRIAPAALVSLDESAFAVNLVLEQGAERFYEPVLSEIERLTSSDEVWVSGVPIFRVATDARTRSELALFVPLTAAVVGLLLALIFGTVQAVMIPLGASGLGTWVMLGAMGALDVPITITTVVLPSVLLALGCAYSVHLISAASGLEPGDQEASIQRVALPIALSGLTTALGFIAIAFVRIEAIQSIGVFGALGVIFVLTATLTAGPAALSLWPMPNRPLRFQSVLQQRITPAILSFTTRRYRLVVVCWLVAMTAVSFGIARLNVETDVIKWFQRDDPIRLAYTKIRDRLSGISPMNVVIEAPAGKRVSAAEVVSAIDSLSEYLEGLPEVGRSVSIADPLRQMHGEFTEDEELPLPGDDALISQYLIVLESEPFTTDLILSDRSSTSILLRVNDNASGALLRVAEAAESWWSENGPSGYTARVTGIMYEFARAEDAIAFGQLRGLAFALLTVSVILLAIFRWVRLAAIALVPNVVPVVMGFGAMGLLGVPLDAGTVVIGNLAFGIAVDDSIHAVTGFFSKRAAGESGERALELAYRSVLPPLVYTTAVVALGFSVLAFSDFTLIRNLGLLTAALMVLCLLADALLLPAMLSRLNGPDKPAAMGVPN